MTQSSEGLQVELEKLTVLVHCQFHAYKRYRTQRVKSWKKLFPNKSEIPILEDERISEIFQNLSATCSGIKSNGKPRGWRIGGQKV